MVDNIFLQISVILGITVSIAFVMRLLRQPLIVAYIIAGLVAGPMFLNMLEHGGQTFDALAEFGVVLLLFVVGLNLNIGHIKKIGHVSVITGVVQVVFTASIGTLLLLMMNFSVVSAVYLAIAITFSSTIIIVKLLNDKKDTETVYGRHTIGLMIVQDVVAVLVMVFMTSTVATDNVGIGMAGLVAKFLILFGFVIVVARFVVPFFIQKVAHSGEFLFIFTITWCFGMASLLYWLGFPLEIGAIVAGITLGSSPFQSEIASRVKPLRDFFIIIFFVILGSEMSLSNISELWGVGIILSLFILIGNPFILYLTFRMLKFTRRNSFLAGVTAAQVSEFGFVLLIVAYGVGRINGLELEIFTVVALTTIIVSSYVITYSEKIYRFLLPFFNLFGKDRCSQYEENVEPYKVWVIGYHRIGWKVCEALAERKIKFAVIDYNPDAISRLKHRGIPAFFGDIADVEFLDSMPLEKAKLIISTIPEADDQKTMINHIRSLSKKTVIICNLYHNNFLDDLYEAGADYIMMPHLLGGQWIAEVLKDSPWTKRTFKNLKKEQKEEMKMRFTMGAHDS
ncbi:MAG: cation:proton antiporter [Candidatus Magasanikbacteria bacterium]